jgi:protein phosphatase PTC7
MLESPTTSFVTACLFLFSLSLPLFLLYRLWVFYRHKSVTTRTSIPEVTANTCLHKVNEVVKNEDATTIGVHSIITSVHYSPKDESRKSTNNLRPYAGEDAFFSYSPNNSSNLVGAMGIADGVGGYSDLGVDAGLMAWQLMENSRDYFIKSAESDDCLYKSPRDILCRAFDSILLNKQVACGGTTACLVSVFKDELGAIYLQYANLGDSGFMVVRNGEVIFRTTDQTHYFNAPYQLAVPPKHRTVIMNKPHEADQFDNVFQVREGDYVILATDGLWDNIFDEDVVKILNDHTKLYTNSAEIVEKTTRELLLKTHAISKNSPKPVYTPFQRYASDNRKTWVGGKVDDISVMVGVIAG